MAWQLYILPAALKSLTRISPPFQDRIRTRIRELSLNPRQPDGRKLVAAKDLYRIRVSAYRVLYQIADRESIVTVVKLGHRREVYH